MDIDTSTSTRAEQVTDDATGSGAAECKQKRCRKGKRYLPQFKSKVIYYAKKHTFKDTSEKFRVHQATVSEWTRTVDQQKVGSDKNINTAEHAFITWLQEMRDDNHIVSANEVKEEVQQLATSHKTVPEWLSTWLKRGESNFSDDGHHLQYPPQFKLEVAAYAKVNNQSAASRVFRVSRKQVSEWMKKEESLDTMVQSGIRRIKPRGRSVTDADVEDQLWTWYMQCEQSGNQPQSSEVQKKACELFKLSGHDNIKCSHGWYKRWTARHGLHSRHTHDDEIIEWILTRFDNNETVTHADLQLFAVSIIGKKRSDFKASPGWAIRFCKRHPLLQHTTSDADLPLQMMQKVAAFHSETQELIAKLNLPPNCIGSMDEFPLHLLGNGTNSKRLLQRSGGNCQVTVVVACLADGTALPPFVILKGQANDVMQKGSIHAVYQQHGQMDSTCMKTWIDTVWTKHVSSPNLLVVDCYEPHVEQSVKAIFHENNTNLAVIPKGCACKLQPLDYAVRDAFDRLVNKLWTDYNDAGGKCVAPGRNKVLDWATTMHDSFQKCSQKIIESFQNKGIVKMHTY